MAVAARAAGDDTFPKLLLRNAAVMGSRPAIREKDLGIWQTWTWAQVADEVRDVALGLQALGLKAGDTVAVVGANRPRLYWTFAAVQSIGGVPVPVYKDSVADEMVYVLEHAEVAFAVVEDQEQTDKVLSMADRLPGLAHIVYDEERGLRHYDHTRLHGFAAVQEIGRAARAADAGLEARWRQGIAAGKGGDLAVILYTSGTTGKPKGVMLSYDNVLISAENGIKFDALSEAEEVIAYLPLAWVGDHIFSYAQSYVSGFCVNCPESPETVVDDRREIGPTYAFAPPRVYENLLTLTLVRMEDASAPKRRMFNYFIEHARRVGEAILDRQPVGLADRLLYGLGEILVYGPLKNRFGFSRIRVAYTAGEAIGPEIFRFFRSIGVNLKQLYGATEAAVYVTMQPDAEIRADTVGKPAPDVEIRISETGEVLYRSPGVFMGYFKNPEATAATKTADGWVHSGDAGFFDQTGHLRIIDRAKDVGRLLSGELFAPKYVENKLKFFPNIKEVVAVGDGRGFCCAMINIDLVAVGNWAERNNVSYASYQELAGHPKVYDIIASHVDQVNRDLAGEPMMSGSQIQRFLVLHKELDADDGELTRTQKVRRGFIAERYAPLVEALYDGSTERYVNTEVTFEDGRKGSIAAMVKIRDMATYPAVRPEPVREAAE
ncbi:AMP-dependent synthetase/ligase [Prosthecomicrobium hirschii]|uniref:AMP-dependent synthetase/ligase n=1 Tax=Prosthecodimorpha hirschii TaxID=665126 RepID=UPI002220D4AC|nr:AMP-binding protein [Prosthecomicrobium hirschii]MCW1840988.1 AMP-binding protein [Prosthecomicrobium hirschii]